MNERICFPYKDDLCDLPEFVKDMNEIYRKMSDELSREILASRILLCLTEDYYYMRNVVLYTKGGKSLNKIISERSQRPQYIYGAGIRGKRLFKLFPNHVWGGFIDKNKNQDSDCSLKILGIEEFLELYVQGMTIFVSNMEGAEGIKQFLMEKGVDADDLFVLNDFDQEGSENMYFQPECIGTSIEKEKAFVDIGCYDGKDALNYMKWNNDYNVKIYAFEPDIRNYKVCAENLKSFPNVKLLNIGLSDKEGEICIAGTGETSHFENEGDRKVRTQLLDHVIQRDSVGYIKMDVEGFEENVLRGAEKIIRDQKPLLAVSLYHKRFDIWRIPILLLNYNKDYRFYLRYYGATNGDTVLYAVS